MAIQPARPKGTGADKNPADRLAMGNFGDSKPVGSGISEMRIDYGPGYRVYLMQRGRLVVILLCGGDKSTQSRDIQKAKIVSADWEK